MVSKNACQVKTVVKYWQEEGRKDAKKCLFQANFVQEEASNKIIFLYEKL